MKKEKIKKSLYLPALRAKMGDWIYYISFMSMKEIATRIDFAEDIHESSSLNDLIQRAVTSRSDQIVTYLLTQEQRFFNSIIIGVYGGTPKWVELTLKGNDRLNLSDFPEYLIGSIGYLLLSGKENLFAIDGQHRVAAINDAVKENKSLEDEEVAIIFVSAKQDTVSRQRIRRLFSTLNRYAKPVGQRDNIALDEDDTVAIVTRMMINDYPFFKGNRINTRRLGKAMPNSDNECITNIISLYDALKIILQDRNKTKWEDFLRFRPDDQVIDAYFKSAKKYWDGLIKYIPEFYKLSRNNLDLSTVRNSNGGHLLFRPIGLQIYTKVVKLFLDDGYSLKSIQKRLSRVNYDLSQAPWKGLLWEPLNKRMIVRGENQTLAIKLLFYMVKGNLLLFDTDVEALRTDYASAINWESDINDLQLPPRI